MFPNILKKLRKEKKLTQSQLAAELGLSKITIYQYESGKREPNFEAMAKLQKFFKVSASYLKGESDINDFENDTSEILETLGTIIYEIEKLNHHLKKLPQEDQLEAYTYLNVSVDLLLNYNINLSKSFEYYSVINKIQLGVHDFIRYLNQVNKNNEPLFAQQLINKFTALITKSLNELLEIYEVNNTNIK